MTSASISGSVASIVGAAALALLAQAAGKREFDRSIRPVTGGTVSRRDQCAKWTCHVRLSAGDAPRLIRLLGHPLRGASRATEIAMLFALPGTDARIRGRRGHRLWPDAAQIFARLRNRSARTLGCCRFWRAGRWPWWLDHVADLSALDLRALRFCRCPRRGAALPRGVR